jgi:hypothetical protein
VTAQLKNGVCLTIGQGNNMSPQMSLAACMALTVWTSLKPPGSGSELCAATQVLTFSVSSRLRSDRGRWSMMVQLRLLEETGHIGVVQTYALTIICASKSTSSIHPNLSIGFRFSIGSCRVQVFRWTSADSIR